MGLPPDCQNHRLFGGTDIQGGVLVNAITGESQYYEEVPSWVDNLYRADLIMEQYDYYGMYHNGFFNSIFGQKDVTVTTARIQLHCHQR